MNVSLTPELERYVQRKLDSGLYGSASEVIRDGLRLLQERDQLFEGRLEQLRSEVRRGVADLDAGRSAPFDTAARRAHDRPANLDRTRNPVGSAVLLTPGFVACRADLPTELRKRPCAHSCRVRCADVLFRS